MTKHRTILKIILNPILRIFGWSIVSKMEDNKFLGYDIRRYPKNCKVVLNDNSLNHLMQQESEDMDGWKKYYDKLYPITREEATEKELRRPCYTCKWYIIRRTTGHDRCISGMEYGDQVLIRKALTQECLFYDDYIGYSDFKCKLCECIFNKEDMSLVEDGYCQECICDMSYEDEEK